ncbi:hypothetical protein ACFPIJ_51625 [Dactylosporangium cerinum]|uniref:histidine kinase n=1 Tax=Dactylosporangium cerinum TaxID=1434730 RepID=A0ABV9WD27_9ACTN
MLSVTRRNRHALGEPKGRAPFERSWDVDVRQQLGQAVDGLTAVSHDLQEISRGIHPAIVSRDGLAPAVRALARRSGLPVELRLDVDQRLPERIEVAAYYIISEALTNAANTHRQPRCAYTSKPTRPA